MIPISIPGLLLAIPLLLFFRALLRPRRRYPPGPAGVPILGNFREFLAGRWYETFTKWQNLYGDIVYAPAPGQSIYIINSFQLAEEALGKSRFSSGRGFSRMVNHLMGWDWILVLSPPSERWSQVRLHFRQAIGPQVVPRYRPLIYDEAIQLIKTLIDFNGDPKAKIEMGIGTIIHKAAYGAEVFKEHGQKILEMNCEGINIIGFARSRFWFVDLIPPLQYIPSWFPGASFQRIAKRSRVVSDYVRYEPWRLVLDRLKRPEGYEDCITTRLIEKVGATDTVRDTVAFIYSAGTDSTTATVMVFLLCIMLHPEAQQRIHEELDRVVGMQRLPTFEDRSSLVYIQAAWKEALRWHPTSPFAVPHVTTEDQTLQGYWVPKGSIIFPNTGFMLRDPEVWEFPELYRPERFLDPPTKNRPDPSIGFGFGQRVCPGRFFAEESGPFVAIAILWAFQIERIEGPARPEDVEWVDSLLSPPLPFKLRFRPRTDGIRQLLKNA